MFKVFLFKFRLHLCKGSMGSEETFFFNLRKHFNFISEPCFSTVDQPRGSLPSSTLQRWKMDCNFGWWTVALWSPRATCLFTGRQTGCNSIRLYNMTKWWETIPSRIKSHYALTIGGGSVAEWLGCRAYLDWRLWFQFPLWPLSWSTFSVDPSSAPQSCL